MLDFFSLGDLFIGIRMGLGPGENSLNTFGNMTHPIILGSQKKFARLDWQKCHLIRSGFLLDPSLTAKHYNFQLSLCHFDQNTS